MTDDLIAIPQTWSIDEVSKALGITRDQINALIRDGKVGYYLGKKRSRRFFVDHIAQIRAALEVPASFTPQADVFSRIGVTRQSASRQRRRAI